MQMIIFFWRRVFLLLLVSSMLAPPLCLVPQPILDLHLFQVFVGGVLVTVVLHLAEVALLWGQHGVNLHNAVADGSVLPLPQNNQADHYHHRYGHRYH